MNASGFSVTSAVELSRRSVKLVELLFPSFNRLVPAIFDTLLPHLPKTTGVETQRSLAVVIRLIANLVGFAWRHQVFPKVIMPAMHADDESDTSSNWAALKEALVPGPVPIRLPVTVSNLTSREKKLMK
jgi:hypothetical protein